MYFCMLRLGQVACVKRFASDLTLAFVCYKPLFIHNRPCWIFTNHLQECSCSPDFFLHLPAFECNTTSDQLNRMIKPIRSYVTFKITNFLEKKTKRMFLRMIGEYGP